MPTPIDLKEVLTILAPKVNFRSKKRTPEKFEFLKEQHDTGYSLHAEVKYADALTMRKISEQV